MNYDVKSPSPPQAQSCKISKTRKELPKLLPVLVLLVLMLKTNFGDATYDGDKVITPAINVAYADRISIDGKKLAPTATRLGDIISQKGW